MKKGARWEWIGMKIMHHAIGIDIGGDTEYRLKGEIDPDLAGDLCTAVPSGLLDCRFRGLK